MNRRDWLKAAGVTGASFALPSAMISAQAASGAAQFDTEIKRLKLRHTWTTTMSSSEFRDTLHVRYTKDGVTGNFGCLANRQRARLLPPCFRLLQDAGEISAATPSSVENTSCPTPAPGPAYPLDEVNPVPGHGAPVV